MIDLLSMYISQLKRKVHNFVDKNKSKEIREEQRKLHMLKLKAGIYYTLKEVAEKLHTSKSTASRIARKFGYGIEFEYKVMRYHESELELMKEYMTTKKGY